MSFGSYNIAKINNLKYSGGKKKNGGVSPMEMIFLQKTVWLGRKTWIRTDYTAYRRQDTYYSDSSYKKVMYTDSIREYFTGN